MSTDELLIVVGKNMPVLLVLLPSTLAARLVVQHKPIRLFFVEAIR